MVELDIDQKKKQISFGRLITRESFLNSSVVPEAIKKSIKKKGDYYLWVYIPSDEILKISIYPIDSRSVTKILIEIEEFSPDLIKGISDILQKLELGDYTIHTTGLCFAGEDCYYETYIESAELKEKIRDDLILKEFNHIEKVKSVKLIDIPIENL